MTRVVGASNATLAVATPAQAFVLAGLVRLGERRPVLVVTPTGASAERLAHDLVAFPPGAGRRGRAVPGLGDAALRAGEPRVSRPWAGGCGCCGSWAADGDRGRPGGRTVPDMVVAPVRALLQRLGPVAHGGPARSWSASGDRIDSAELVAGWWRSATGGSTRSSTGASWPCGAGSSTCSRRPPSVPVRIDLWGDEVDRLTEFDVADQRSIDDLDEVELFGCRELLADRGRAGPGRPRWSGTEPWGRHQWERLAEGQLFDGMESWLPWLADDERAAARPARRRRPGGAGRSPADARPGRRAATTRRRPWPTPWPSPGASTPAASDFPRLHVPFDRLLAETDGRRSSRWCRRGRGPGHRRWWRPRAGSRCSATGPGWPPSSAALVEAGYSVVLCADGRRGRAAGRASWPRRAGRCRWSPTRPPTTADRPAST